MRKVLFLSFFIFILALAQTSFFVHLGIKGIVPNLVLISSILIIYFFPQIFPKEDILDVKIRPEIFVSFLGGLFLDIFSSRSFTTSFVLFIFLSLFLRKVLESLNRFNIILFIFIFVFSLIFYDFCLAVLERQGIDFNTELFLIKILYNISFAALAYFLFVKALRLKTRRKQQVLNL